MRGVSLAHCEEVQVGQIWNAFHPKSAIIASLQLATDASWNYLLSSHLSENQIFSFFPVLFAYYCQLQKFETFNFIYMVVGTTFV